MNTSIGRREFITPSSAAALSVLTCGLSETHAALADLATQGRTEVPVGFMAFR